ncbi:unnamed protein product [Litomosoides sigmodontis]|uniref:Serine/threonine specific protein phosphatases domain-containing protein n=1 Tax=Litomosoides sigmodontis TaxID=42156 RepID=A0A3P6TVL3_LITSI|nr:unnamed protein product [Litomosoides sigmodontis]
MFLRFTRKYNDEMTDASARAPCKQLNYGILNSVIVSILQKSFRDGILALVWMNREIMISLIHEAIDLINRSDEMFLAVSDDLLEQRMVFVVGSIDGDLINLVTLLKNEMPPKAYYIFLGDYLDCFKPSRIDALLLLLSLKLRHPRHICLLRGHHETYEMCKAIGFDKAIDDERLLRSFFVLFEYLPILGVFGKFLCLHAGISPFMSDDSFLQEFVKPIEVKRMTARERATLTDILYGIPDRNLPALFAPSNVYPIGFRFSLAGLREVLEVFDCKQLIRGCGRRNSNHAYFDFDASDCVSIVSGRSARHRNYDMHRIDKEHIWNLKSKHSFEKSANTFINDCDSVLRSVPRDFQFDLPRGCAACDWIDSGKDPENVTVSHTLLKTFAEEMMYPRKLDHCFLLDPRLEQYMYVELFPLCDDFYFYGIDQLVASFPFISEHPLIKPPTSDWHEEMTEADAGPSREKEYDCNSQAYINGIVRPGYDLGRDSRQDSRRLRQLQHWLRGIFAYHLSPKYRVERLPPDDSE